MKNEYERPSMEVITFSSEDVIICSNNGNETEIDQGEGAQQGMA